MIERKRFTTYYRAGVRDALAQQRAELSEAAALLGAICPEIPAGYLYGYSAATRLLRDGTPASTARGWLAYETSRKLRAFRSRAS